MNEVPLSRMRDRVTIQDRTITQDSFGQGTPTWFDLATVWAFVEPLSGREAWQAQMVRPDVTHQITMRAYPGLHPRMRLKLGTRTFNIESVIDVENRGRQHTCVCKELLS